MPIRIKPTRQPKMSLREERRRAYEAHDRLCGVLSQQPRSFGKKKS